MLVSCNNLVFSNPKSICASSGLYLSLSFGNSFFFNLGVEFGVVVGVVLGVVFFESALYLFMISISFLNV